MRSSGANLIITCRRNVQYGIKQALTVQLSLVLLKNEPETKLIDKYLNQVTILLIIIVYCNALDSNALDRLFIDFVPL